MSLSIIGVMSGSSLDGLDMALCFLEETDGKMNWKIAAAHTIPYNPEWKSKLKHAALLSGKELMALDAAFGIYIGEQVNQWILDHRFAPDFIASHGHTVFHEPDLHFTTQIGSGAHIAAVTSVDTITSFRHADVALGGQGAPFAPVADRDLFGGYDGFLNLGGIANLSLCLGSGIWKAWDICPCNQALNFLAEKIGLAYDDNGYMAGTGEIDEHMVATLVSLFPPHGGAGRSLSNESVHATWISYLEKSTASIPDSLASVVKAIATTIVAHIRSCTGGPVRVLVTGGGAHNSTLLHDLNASGGAYGMEFVKPDTLIIDFKESLLMAYLGYLTAYEKTYGIHSMTGATRDSIGGAVFKAS